MIRLSRQPDKPPLANPAQYESEAQRMLAEGFPLMYFTPRLEALFEEETSGARSRHLVAVGILWTLVATLYALFTTDVDSPGNLRLYQLVRLGVVIPLLLGVTFAIWYGIQPVLREFLMMLANIVAPASVILVVTLVQGGEAGAVRGALTMILLFITVVVRLRFWFAAIACFSLVAIQVGAPAIVGAPVPGNVPLVLATIAATLVANYTLEREYRLNYLQRVMGRIQSARSAELVDQLHDLSQSDALTGLPNRRALDAQLEELCRSGQPFSVIIVDVDAFKALNDEYGHQIGDDCLKRVAAMLRASLRRTSDRVARMGGEEFAVVLPDTGLEDAHRMAERMRRAILDLRIPHAGSPEDGIVSISAGVAEAQLPTTPAAVLSEADRAMYQAKDAGRNRVMLYTG